MSDTLASKAQCARRTSLAGDNQVESDHRVEVKKTRTVPRTWTAMHARHIRRASTIGNAVEGQWSTRCVARTPFSDMCAHAGDPAAASFARPSALTALGGSLIPNPLRGWKGESSCHTCMSRAFRGCLCFFLNLPLRGFIHERVHADYRGRTPQGTVQHFLGVTGVGM